MTPINWRTTVHGILAAVFTISDIWVHQGTKVDATVKTIAALFLALGLYSAADKQNLGK